MCSIDGAVPAGTPRATHDVLRAATVSVRGLPPSARGAAAAAEAELLLGLVESATAALLERLAVVDADRVAHDDVSLSPSSWLRRRTKGTQTTAAAMVRLARRLHHDPDRPLPLTAAAYSDGRLSTAQVEAIAAVCAKAPVQVVPDLEATLAAHPELEADELTRSARAMVQRLREQASEVPAGEAEHRGRFLRVSPTLDGWVHVEGMLEPDAGAYLRAALDPLAAPATTTTVDGSPARDPRGPGERMHDALVELVRLAADAEAMPAQGGTRPHLQLLIDAGTLLQTRPTWRGTTVDGHRVHPEAIDEAVCDPVASFVLAQRAVLPQPQPWPQPSPGQPPGQPMGQHLGQPPGSRPDADPGGIGPPGIDPDIVRQVLSTISPALGGIPMAVLAAGRERRLVTPSQRRALDARDKGCVVPGCTVPARRCQAHHLVPWRFGGSTDERNLASA